MKKELSILIPVYNNDCRRQVTELSRQAQLLGDDLTYEIIVADDASTDRSMAVLNKETGQLPNVRFIEGTENRGRARIRNFLAHEARYEWLLFMDCDMTVSSPSFIDTYLSTPDEAPVVYGGYYVGDGPADNLRYRYEKAAEEEHTAEKRKNRPYQHFHTANFLVKREVMLANPFDERFVHYGYEDVLFGKSLRKKGISILHIDNPAGFCSFEDNDSFVNKTEEALQTLYAFSDDLRGYSNILSFVQGIHLGIIRSILIGFHKATSRLMRRNLCGRHPNLTVFKLYKIGYYLSLTKN